MQRNVVCYEEHASVQSICEFLSRVAVRRVVIVHDGRPVGVISRGSLLRWYSNWIRVQQQGAGKGPDSNDARTRQHLIQGVQAAARCAVELAESVSTRDDDPLPPVVEGVSRLQELINDLLSCAPFNVPVVVSGDAGPPTSGLMSSQAPIVG
jgi:two-component system cell cycle response regulator